MIRGPVRGEICILAGGLSARMGRDKRRLRLRGKTLLRYVREAALQPNSPLRVIRRDLVPRCGPLGGVYTALKTTRCDRVLFLACDMPFISSEYVAGFLELTTPTFAHGPEGAGFPFLLHKAALSIVQEQMAAGRFSLQSLAWRCCSRIAPRPENARELFNVNTPEDWELARQIQSETCHSSQKR
jgi:molybdopterin-guanine dinucleotide biosynthesis protein A